MNKKNLNKNNKVKIKLKRFTNELDIIKQYALDITGKADKLRK